MPAKEKEPQPTTESKFRNRVIRSANVDPATLVPNVMNWRLHPDPQRAALGASLTSIGWVQQVIVNERTGHIVDGHLRVDLALAENEATVPVDYVDLSEEEEAVILATFDPITMMAQAETATLNALMESVQHQQGDAIDLLFQSVRSVVDLSEFELPTSDDIALDVLNGLDTDDDVTANDRGPQMKRAAELMELWDTQRGQVWKLGEHRLLIGDATSWREVSRLMNGEQAQLCFTSPPYWVGKDYETQTSIDEVRAFIKSSASVMSKAITKDGGRIVINTSTARAQAIDPHSDTETLFSLAWWQDALRDFHWLMRHCRLWVKRGQLAAPSISPNADVVDQHWETVATFLPTFYNADGARRGQQRLGMSWAQQGVWDDLHGEANMDVHGAAFPLELPLRYLALYSVEAESVFEPFAGTGTVLIACEQTNRKCFACELDPAYAAVTIQRWVDLTKLVPILL